MVLPNNKKITEYDAIVYYTFINLYILYIFQNNTIKFRVEFINCILLVVYSMPTQFT